MLAIASIGDVAICFWTLAIPQLCQGTDCPAKRGLRPLRFDFVTRLFLGKEPQLLAMTFIAPWCPPARRMEGAWGIVVRFLKRNPCASV